MLIPSRFIRQMLANFFGIFKVREKKKKIVALCSHPRQKGEIRHFYVVVVQRRQRRQNCYFANLNLLVHCRFCCLRRRRCLSALLAALRSRPL